MVLLSPAHIGGLNLKNRILRSATAERRANEQGLPTEALIQFYEALAQGGVGAIVTGMISVHPRDTAISQRLSLSSDAAIVPFHALTDRVHLAGCPLIAQLVVTGSNTTISDAGILWGPSAVEHKMTHMTPKEMTTEEISEVILSFGEAARRAKLAGFDAVEIHAAHGFLLSNWLAPYYNHRSDDYGGSLENRARLLLNVYDEMREQVGADYPIWVKFHGDDFFEGGMTAAEAMQVCQWLDKRGIQLIEVSGGNPIRRKLGVETEEGYFRTQAAQIAASVKTDVASVGGYRRCEQMEYLLHTSGIAAFSLSRPLLSEPDLVRHWITNPAYLPRCTSCTHCFRSHGPMHCTLDE